jgi:ADP-ribose pyrophosphatase YjhB (NUDIX family)
MEQRISSAGIVVQDDGVVLMHHFQENVFDFWVMPGGGVEGNEGILKTAEREVFEETNLKVTAERIAYIEDFIDQGRYVCKFWV